MSGRGMTEQELSEDRTARRVVQIGPHRHYKGGMYTVLYVARDSTDNREGRHVVVYCSHTNGNIFARDWEEFCGMVNGEPRFKHVPNYLGPES